MKLAVVTGQIVCTVRHHGLAHDKLLMVEMIDPQGNPDKSTVFRARKIQKFLSQPFHVAENFTGIKGKYVPVNF